MKNYYDIIIVGAGPVGCVIAERCATVLDWKVLLIDKRDHIAGNCYDEKHSSGIFIHKYGPHYFRTNNKELIDYLSQFTEWIEGAYYIKSKVKDKLYNFPINLLTINRFFNLNLDENAAQKYLQSIRANIPNPQNSEEYVLSRIGKALYEAFYLGYTLKQWGIHPKDLNKSVCGRIPVRFNKDERYVDHKYQVMPKNGFAQLFSKMTNHPNIEISLSKNFKEIDNQKIAKNALVYSGPIDEYFDYKYGKLGWRSLKFDFVEYQQEFKQECVQINYPNDFDYTRTVEIKHVTKQKTDNTVISYEYPMASGDPYYPIPIAQNEKLFAQYKLLAEQETLKKNVHFCGRLATYSYLNTDEAIEKALETFEKIKKNAEK